MSKRVVNKRTGRYATAVMAAIVLVLSAGCASFGSGREAPRVSLSDIRVLEASLFEQQYAVTLRIQNPSDRSLSLRGSSVDLEVNGRDFGHGVSDDHVTVPPFGDAKIEVRMVSTLFGMVRLIQGLRDRGAEPLTYELSGWLKVDGRLGSVGFREAGEFALPETRTREHTGGVWPPDRT
jgi:LEA14-like dessication related protein